MTSEHLLSANLTTREYVFVLQNAKILTAFTQDDWHTSLNRARMVMGPVAYLEWGT